MFQRTLSAAVLNTAGAGLIGGALAFAPPSQAAPGGDAQPPCVAERTCALLTPKIDQGQGRYLPLTPPPSSASQYAPLTPR